MNKKAQLSVGIFVALVVALVGTTLFLFLSNDVVKKDKLHKLPLDFISDLEKRETLTSYYVEDFSRDALVAGYNAFAGKDASSYVKVGSSYARNVPGYGNVVIFDELRTDLNGVFEGTFRQHLNYVLQDKDFVKKWFNVQATNGEGSWDYDVEFDGENLIVVFRGFGVGQSQYSNAEDISIYRTDIPILINLNEIGLHSFQEIYDAKEACENVSCMEQRLSNFDVEFNSENEVWTLKTKRHYLINENFQQIEITFKR